MALTVSSAGLKYRQSASDEWDRALLHVIVDGQGGVVDGDLLDTIDELEETVEQLSETVGSIETALEQLRLLLPINTIAEVNDGTPGE